MDPDAVALARQAIDAAQAEIARLARQSELMFWCMCVLLVVGMVCMVTLGWSSTQRAKAERRVHDRLAREAAPEASARRQARQAHIAALVAQELSAMRRNSWPEHDARPPMAHDGCQGARLCE